MNYIEIQASWHMINQQESLYFPPLPQPPKDGAEGEDQNQRKEQCSEGGSAGEGIVRDFNENNRKNDQTCIFGKVCDRSAVQIKGFHI